MTKKRLWLGAGLGLCLCFMGNAVEGKGFEGRKNCLVKKIFPRINLDGNVEPNEWKGVTALTGFTSPASGKLPKEKTELYLGYDKTNLYIGFICYQKEIKADAQERDDYRIFNDDNMEIFLDIGYSCKSCYHLTVNASGIKFDQRAGARVRDASWNENWKTAVYRGENYWSGEIVVPFKVLGIKSPEEGAVWGVNFCRTNIAGKEIARWGVPLGSNHQPDLFGAAIFGSYSANLASRIRKLKSEIEKQKGKIASLEGAVRNEVEERLSSLNEKLKLIGRSAGKRMTNKGWKESDRIIEDVSAEIKKLNLIGQEYVIWEKNPMVKMKPDMLPKTDKDLKEINISAYMNEVEPASFVITNLTDETLAFRILIHRLRRKDEGWHFYINPERIEIRAASFVNPPKSPRVWLIGDALPLLNEANEIIVPDDQSREIWLSLDTKGIIPGDYEGEIVVVPHYKTKLKVMKLNVKVYPMRLPDNDKMPVTVELFPQFTSYGAMIPEKNLEAIVQDIANHRINTAWLENSYLPWLDKNGELDKNKLFVLDKYLLLFKKYSIKPLFFLFGAKIRSSGAQPVSPAWIEVFKTWISALAKHMKEIGFDYSDYVISLNDEGGGGKEYIEAHKILRQIDPKMKVWQCHQCPEVEELTPYVDIFCPSLKAIGTKYFSYLKSTGKPIWYYNNRISNKSSSPLGCCRRSYLWIVWKYKIQGGGFWGYDQVKYQEPYSRLESDPWTYWSKVDHGSVIYTDDRWRAKPVPSRRWEIFRDGVEDYLYLHILKESIEKAKKKGLDTKKGENLLKEFDEKVYSDDNPDTIYKFREKLAKETVSLNSEMGFEITRPAVSEKDNGILIQWETSKPAMGGVFYWKADLTGAMPNLWETCREKELSTSHSICLKDIEKGRKYLFGVFSANEIGYVKIRDRGGSLYKFKLEEK